MWPVIKVWCLPRRMSEVEISGFYHRLAEIAGKLLELQREEMTFLFPMDRMKFGLGEDIVVEVDGLFAPRPTHLINFADILGGKKRDLGTLSMRLARALGEEVKHDFPKARVQVIVRKYDPFEGSWSSETKEKT